MYPFQTGICGNQSPPLRDSLRNDTFMHHLREADYYTALIGKHHYLDRYGLGVDVTSDDDEVKRYGFDSVFQVTDDGENLLNDDEYTKHLAKHGLLEQFRKCKVQPNHNDWTFKHPFDEENTVDGFIGTNGVRFIADYNRDQPFYLFLSFIGPHPPLWHPNELRHRPDDMPAPVNGTDDEHTKTRRAHYMDRCSYIDSYVGQVVAALEQRGILDQTVIIFTSDHGDTLGDHRKWDKRFMFKSSVEVPLVIRNPDMAINNRLDGPQVSRALVSHVDLYPTILALAGIDPPPSRARDGRNLMDVVNHVRGSSHGEVFADLATTVMIRTPNWKLVIDPQQGGIQYLFNLAVDPDERENLAGHAGYETVTRDLVQQILAQRIRLTQYTHAKEEQRLQRVHVD
jgi:arylsulfatase A-like enzyme